MAFAGVTIDIVDKASSRLRRINEQAQKAGKTFQRFDKATKGITTRFNGLSKVIAQVGLAEFGRRSIQTAANFDKLNLRLKLLTKESGTFAKSQKIATDAQKLFGISTIEALEGVTNITARLAPLGVGVEDIRTTFIGFNTAAKLAGATGIEASNAFRQLAQALGSGRLQGDEFRSISEQIPTLLKPVADELGTTVGKLKEFSSQGKITSEVVIRALGKIGNEGAPMLAALLENDPTQVFKNLNNEIQDLQITIGQTLLPTAKLLTLGLTGFSEVINTLPKGFTAVVIGATAAITAFTILSPIATAIKGTFVALLATLAKFGIVLTGPVTAGIALLGLAIAGIAGHYIDANKEQKEFNKILDKGTVAQIDNAIATNDNTISKIKNEMARKRSKTAAYQNIAALEEENRKLKEQKRISKNLLDRGFDTSKGTYEVNGIIYDSKTGRPKNPPKTISDVIEDQNKPLTDKKDPRLMEVDITKQIQRRIQLKNTEDEKDRLILERKFLHMDQLREIIGNEQIINKEKAIGLLATEFEIDKTKILNDTLTEQADIYEQIGDSIATGITDALTDAAMGAKTLGEAAVGVLQNIGRQLMQLGINTLLFNVFGGAGGIFKNLPTFAAGGRPPVGRPSIVGERGPELFTPSVSGTITPNHALGGSTNVVVNVDASGSSVEGDEDRGRELGRIISAAIQSELINEKRPGGLLA
jgi:tape measure domain-containing protein